MGNIPSNRRFDVNPVIATSIAVILVIASVIGFALWRGIDKQKQDAAQIDTALSGLATFTVGEDDAPVTIDIVEDFICPSCRQFEVLFGAELHRMVDDGELKIRFHIVNFMDRASASGDYSTRALAAALYVSEHAPEHWMAFHAELFRNQPEEGGKQDLTDNQIADLAIKAGVPYDIAQKLRDIEPLAPPAEAAANKTIDYINENIRRVSTPMVIRNGKEIEVTPEWLNAVK